MATPSPANPYQPPRATRAAKLAATTGSRVRGVHRYEPLSWRTPALLILLGAFGLACMGSAAAEWNVHQLAVEAQVSGGVGNVRVQSADRLTALTALLYLITYMTTVVFWCLWIHRAYRNTGSITASPTTSSPAWAVGCHFIPFISLAVPPQIMAQTWRRSRPILVDGRRTREALTPLIPAWWIVWILLGLLGWAQMFLRNPKTPSELDTMALTSLATSGLGVVVSVLAMLIIVNVHRRQAESVTSMAHAAEATNAAESQEYLPATKT